MILNITAMNSKTMKAFRPPRRDRKIMASIDRNPRVKSVSFVVQISLGYSKESYQVIFGQ